MIRQESAGTDSRDGRVSGLSATAQFASQLENSLAILGCLIQHAGDDLCLTQNEIARYVEMISGERRAGSLRYAGKLKIAKEIIAQE